MTLCTTLALTSPNDAHEVFHHCRGLLGADRRHRFHDRARNYGEGWEIGNALGQGLPALMWVNYRPGGDPLRSPKEASACEEDCEPDCKEDHAADRPACWAEVCFDTAYAYHDNEGRGCGDLHAQLLFDLGQWLDERGIVWGWQNEFTGDWHWEDRYAALKDLCTEGGRAMAWFTEIVAPLIEVEMRA